MGWATQYMQMKTAQSKTAGHIWNAAAGGLPYAISMASHSKDHGLTPEQRSEAIGGVSAPLAARMRTVLPGIGYGLLGAGLGAGLGYGYGEFAGDTSVPVDGFSSSGIPPAVLGAGIGGGLGILAGSIKGSWDAGKDYAAEQAAEVQRPTGNQKSFFARHPILTTLGGASLVSSAVNAIPGLTKGHDLDYPTVPVEPEAAPTVWM